MNLQGKLLAREFLAVLEKERPVSLLHQWVKVRRAGEEDKVYTHELRRTLITMWERWSDEEEVGKEFSFLFLIGRWHFELSAEDLNQLPLQPIIECIEIWMKERCSRK